MSGTWWPSAEANSPYTVALTAATYRLSALRVPTAAPVFHGQWIAVSGPRQTTARTPRAMRQPTARRRRCPRVGWLGVVTRRLSADGRGACCPGSGHRNAAQRGQGTQRVGVQVSDAVQGAGLQQVES